MSSLTKPGGWTHPFAKNTASVSVESVCEGFFPSGIEVVSYATCAQHYKLTLNSLIKILAY